MTGSWNGIWRDTEELSAFGYQLSAELLAKLNGNTPTSQQW